MAQFNNNRNNGDLQNKAPSVPYNIGDFIVPDGIGHFIPYAKATTVTTGAFTGTFVLGETVTQATSGATGVVEAISTTAPSALVLKSVTGTFDATHVLTGGTSGATATASAVSIIKNIMGISNRQVQSTDSDYAMVNGFSISTPVKIQDYLNIPVSSGTATAAMEGTYVDVDPANPGSVIVGVVGTQIFITKFINATTIMGSVALPI